MRTSVLVAVLVLPALASARPLLTVGAGIGLTQSKADAGADANEALNLFGRIGLTSRLSGQLEVQQIQTDDQNSSIRTGTALARFDFGSGRLMPSIMIGVGIDTASGNYGNSTDAHHFEGGFGLEYRSTGGFVIGADARMGGRSIDSQTTIEPLHNNAAYRVSSTLQDGEYRSVRLTLGVRF